MRYISTTDTNITFTDTNGKVMVVPKNRVYTHFNVDTITFLLIERYDNEGICIFTTIAEDLEINGTTYTYEQLLDGEGISDLFSPTGSLSYKIVDELPQTGTNGVIYLVPKGDNSYAEYLWIEDEERYEMLGDVGDIDLTNYYTKTQVDEKLVLKANASEVYTKTEADNKFLTEHQSLDNYYTKDEVYNKTESDAKYATQVVVNEEIAARIQGDADINTTLGTKADKSDTYTKTQVDDALALKQDASTAFSGDYDDLTNKPDLSVYAESADLATVATSGSYDDLSDKPVIPESVTVDAELSDTSENPVQNKVVKGALDAKQDTISDLATIRNGAALGATAYQKPNDGIPASDLASGVIPTVPTNVSAFTNDAGYLTEHQSLDNYYTKSEVDTELADKQDTLTAGANITIDANNVISSTGGTQQQADWNQTDTTAVDYIKNKPAIPDTSDFATKTELNAKQDTLVSGTNVKTINNQSILGAGNIEIQGGGGGMDEDTELLISSALVDLNDRKIDATEVKENYQKKGDYATNAKVDTKANISDVPTNEDYEEAQKITSWSLNELNKRIVELEARVAQLES